MYSCFFFISGSPVTRWASVAFGAGVGIGSAYTECSYKFDGSPAKLATPKTSDPPLPVRVISPMIFICLFTLFFQSKRHDYFSLCRVDLFLDMLDIFSI